MDKITHNVRRASTRLTNLRLPARPRRLSSLSWIKPRWSKQFSKMRADTPTTASERGIKRRTSIFLRVEPDRFERAQGRFIGHYSTDDDGTTISEFFYGQGDGGEEGEDRRLTAIEFLLGAGETDGSAATDDIESDTESTVIGFLASPCGVVRAESERGAGNSEGRLEHGSVEHSTHSGIAANSFQGTGLEHCEDHHRRTGQSVGYDEQYAVSSSQGTTPINTEQDTPTPIAAFRNDHTHTHTNRADLSPLDDAYSDISSILHAYTSSRHSSPTLAHASNTAATEKPIFLPPPTTTTTTLRAPSLSDDSSADASYQAGRREDMSRPLSYSHLHFVPDPQTITSSHDLKSQPSPVPKSVQERAEKVSRDAAGENTFEYDMTTRTWRQSADGPCGVGKIPSAGTRQIRLSVQGEMQEEISALPEMVRVIKKRRVSRVRLKRATVEVMRRMESFRLL